MTRSMRDSRLIRQRTSTACTVEAGTPSRPAICDRPEPVAPAQSHDPAHHRGGVLVGLRAAASSGRPSRPGLGGSGQPTFAAVAGATMNIFAAGSVGPAVSTTSRARRRRARGVRAALAWDTKASGR